MDTVYYGTYRGIVVQNDDPLTRGRVKVWVPSVNATMYSDWNQLIANAKGDSMQQAGFVFLGKNTNSSLTPILQRLKEVLPWAEVVQPIVGSGVPGFYYSPNDQGNISYGSEKNSGIFGDCKKGACFAGANRAHSYATNAVADAYSEVGSESSENAFGNPYAHNYRPADLHNAPRGSFSVPGVGAHVLVMFEGGNPMTPLITGILYGNDDLKSIFRCDKSGVSVDYPAGFENVGDGEKAQEGDAVYRSKYTINERGGSFEIVSTTGREGIRITHFSGSMLEMTNNVTVRLATGNDQALIMRDQFTTVRGTKSEFVGQSNDTVVMGDNMRKVGAIKKWQPLSEQYSGALKPLQEIKKLFDLKRLDKAGEPAKCPVCSQDNEFSQLVSKEPDKLTDGEALEVGTGDLWGTAAKTLTKGDSKQEKVKGDGKGKIGDAPCWCCNGKGESPSTQDGKWEPETQKEELADKIKEVAESLSMIEAQFGSTALAEGGNDIEMIGKNAISVVGTIFNDAECVRMDPAGKLVPGGYKISPGAVYPFYRPAPLLEAIHIDDLPGGDKETIACSKYSVLAGAGGMRLRTVGSLQMSGHIVALVGQEVNISGRYGVNIDGGSRLDLEGEIISLRPRETETEQGKTKLVNIEGGLCVADNLLVRGGAHIDGELTTHHITAPREYRLTEPERTITKASMKPDFIIGVISIGGVMYEVTSLACDKCIEVNPHAHFFESIASTLVGTHNEVREVALKGNELDIILANPVASATTLALETAAKADGGTHEEVTTAKDPEFKGEGPGTALTGSESKQRSDQFYQSIASS